MIDYQRHSLEEYIRDQARPVDKFSHQPRLYHLAVRIGVGMMYDDDVLHAAAWLHDLGVFIGHRPENLEQLARWNHLDYVLRVAPGILKRFGFPQTKMPAVLEAIRTHMPQSVPTTIEGTILRDADILEQLGAIGILRTVCKIGRDTRYKTFADALANLQRSLDTLPAQLKLPTALALAEERIVLLRDLLAAADKEADGQPL